MGQQHYQAIVYGAIMAPAQDAAMNGDNENGILEEWRVLVSEKIQATVMHPQGFWGEKERNKQQEYVPHQAYESADRWIGFFVAITDDDLADWWGKAGVIRNQACAVTNLAKMFPVEQGRAEKRWARFAKFCAKRGLELTGQQLFVSDFD